MEELRSVKAGLLQEKEKLAKEKETLKRELKNLKDPRYQKHLIHKELGLVEEGEVMIKFHE